MDKIPKDQTTRRLLVEVLAKMYQNWRRQAQNETGSPPGDSVDRPGTPAGARHLDKDQEGDR